MDKGVNLIKEGRLKAKMTKTQMADKMGIDRRIYARMEARAGNGIVDKHVETALRLLGYTLVVLETDSLSDPFKAAQALFNNKIS